MIEIQTRTRGRQWMAIRRRVLMRDCGMCAVCLAQGIEVKATEVDHINPLAAGGTDDEGNLQSLCHDCHADKTAREQGFNVRKPIGLNGWPLEHG